MQEGGTKSRNKNVNDLATTDSSTIQSSKNLSKRLSFSSSIRITPDKGSEADTQKRNKKEDASIIRLAYLNRPELPALLIGCIAASMHGVVFPVFGFLMATAFGIFFEDPKKLEKDSRFWALMFVAVGALLLVAAPFQNYMFGVSGGKLVQRVRSLLFQKVVHQEISWFDDPSNSRLNRLTNLVISLKNESSIYAKNEILVDFSGAVGARLSADASTVRNLVGDTLALAVQNIATTIAGVMIAFLTNWKLALTVVVVVPLMLVEGYFRVKLIKEGCNKVY